MNTSETPGTSFENKVAILEEIVSDSEISFTWEQTLDMEDVIRSLDEDDHEMINQHFQEALSSLSLIDRGFATYEDILAALRGD